MSSVHPTLDAPAGQGSFARFAALPVFALAIFVSAFLLFSVQPMFTKMVLPVLGGTPAVWSVAMVFFQGVLLIGYGYAHLLARLLDPRRAVLVHLAMMAGVLVLALPIGLAAGWGRPPADGEALWLIGLFAASVGLPFFALAGNGPLLQAWFARTGHRDAADPYFLYGASNLGSFLALLSYPFVIEPMLPLKAQSALWASGFAGLGGLILLAGMVLARTVGTPAEPSRSGPAARPVVAWRDRLAWIGLAAVPSGLLVALTAHLSTDVAAVPLLWVLPLALFLLTFVLAFRERGAGLHRIMVAIQPLMLAGVIFAMALSVWVPWPLAAALHVGFFFVATMVCHGELYRRRPDAVRLTEFYVLLSVGGVIGGIFASLAAPVLFSSILEYPILVVAAVLCRPGMGEALARPGLPRIALGAGLLAATIAMQATTGLTFKALPALVYLILIGAVAAAVLLGRDRPVVLLAGALSFFAVSQAPVMPAGTLARERSFFAVHEVQETASGEGRLLVHGVTVHGAERVRHPDGSPVAGRPEPASYYHRGGPFAEAIGAVRAARPGRGLRVAAIGLGVGSLACYSEPGDAWTFLEIDPVVVRIARDTRLFASLTRCAPEAPVVIGDGRLTLADQPGPFDLIIVDAFSSDAIPVHLLTREAFAGYLDKLAPDGALIFHITNRNMDLRPVVAGSARAHGLIGGIRQIAAAGGGIRDTLTGTAMVAMVARESPVMGPVGPAAGWQPLVVPEGFRPWTDDYSNIIDPMIRRFRQP
ncbi:MAG: fused MFS/spermidine synthase [Phreatobacter sp.]